MAIRKVSEQVENSADLDDREEDQTQVEAQDQDEELDPETEEEAEDPDADDDEQSIGDEETDEPVRTRGARGDRQFGSVRERARQAEERARQLEHELQLERARQQGGSRQQPDLDTPEVRRARYAAMDPDDRAFAIAEDMRREFQTTRAQDAWRAQDQADRAAYDARATANPRYKKYGPEVERRLAVLRASGANAPRQIILEKIIGERVLEGGASPAVKKQKSAAAQRVASQKSTLPRARGEMKTARNESERAARARRLENVPI